jgi:hypothetical protein
MKKLILFILLMIFGALLAIAADVAVNEVATAADAGFTFLELILMLAGAPAGGLAILAVRVARQGTKTVLKSLDSNPYVDNKKLLLHASSVNDKKATKEFRKINREK